MLVRPYRGKNYGVEKPFGFSILVLGESSYDDETNVDGPLSANWSEGIISHVYREQRDPSITRAACVFAGELKPFSWRQRFWDTAAFTN
jgi:hypothetical protein